MRPTSGSRRWSTPTPTSRLAASAKASPASSIARETRDWWRSWRSAPRPRDSAEVVREIARVHPGIYAAVGIHPNDAAEAGPDDWKAILELAREPEVVAIGETGLDRSRDRTPFRAQQAAFDRHLDLAQELDLPVIIHCRQGEADLIDQLSRRGRPIKGVLHSFVGDHEQAAAFLELGLHLSIAGQVTFANKALDALRDAAGQIPGDRLLIETDSPYLSPHPHRGRPNEPARVVHSARRLAEVRGISPESLAASTTANAIRLFGLKDFLPGADFQTS